MAASFQLDAQTMPFDPYEVVWEPKEVIDRNHAGAPLENIKRKATLRLPDMTVANFTTIEAHDDGATHTAKIPRITDAAYTTYSGVYVRLTSFSQQDINYYGVELEISWIEI